MRQEIHVLIVDDEVNIRNALVTILEKAGYRAQGAESAESALALMTESPSDLLITDVRMPGIGGIALVEQVKSRWPATEIIVITAYGSIETAVEAMRLGAYDFLTKPIDRDRFSIVVKKALDRQRLAAENQDLRHQLEVQKRIEEMIGESEAMSRIHKVIAMVAKNDVTILIGGESGTGKELVARGIHQKSRRAHGPFIPMNCGALPESLFESELFGYEKGAFSGAVGTKPGRFELADEGTLFLDEIGELPLKAQVDFLRVLETGEFRRLGGKSLITVNARIIAATNRNLAHLVENGQFREDLYYRINVVPIHLPPLRERREDIPVLIDYFLKEFARRHQIQLKTLSLSSLRFLIQYQWPGNIRQLRNVIERLVVTVKEHSVQPDHLPEEIRTSVKPGNTMAITLGTPLEDIEREVIRRTLVEVTHHREQAAKLLGISVRSLQYKIKEYGIEI
ncbi:MAG: sigma-54-dependent transcriptional regulator [Nitrospirales bacterium]